MPQLPFQHGLDGTRLRKPESGCSPLNKRGLAFACDDVDPRIAVLQYGERADVVVVVVCDHHMR